MFVSQFFAIVNDLSVLKIDVCNCNFDITTCLLGVAMRGTLQIVLDAVAVLGTGSLAHTLLSLNHVGILN